MLVVSNERLVPMTLNTMILQGDDGSFYYFNRDLYDQAVVLWDVCDYGEKTDILINALGIATEATDGVVKEFYDKVPAPLKALAFFLPMVKGVEGFTSFEDLVGAISVMSMSINFRRMPKVPKVAYIIR